ncbi:hypothetical protein EC968_009509, partial [Mortierella alpina]
MAIIQSIVSSMWQKAVDEFDQQLVNIILRATGQQSSQPRLEPLQAAQPACELSACQGFDGEEISDAENLLYLSSSRTLDDEEQSISYKTSEGDDSNYQSCPGSPATSVEGSFRNERSASPPWDHDQLSDVCSEDSGFPQSSQNVPECGVESPPTHPSTLEERPVISDELASSSPGSMNDPDLTEVMSDSATDKEPDSGVIDQISIKEDATIVPFTEFPNGN